MKLTSLPRPPLKIRQIGTAALDLVFPRSCVVSGEPVEAGAYRFLGREAARAIWPVEPPHCRTCGAPLWGMVSGPRSCPHCCELDPVFDEGRTAFVLRGTIRRMLHLLKYEQGTHLLPDFKTLLAGQESFFSHLQDSVLVPVPLHPRKQRERGFNQSLLLARLLGEITPSANLLPCLRRVEDTPSQTRLNRSQREANVKNAFAILPGVSLDSGLRYIVVDDVFTTGATLNACAATLRQAGAESVDVATIAHG